MNEWDSRCEKQTNKQKTVRTSTTHEGFHDLSFTLQGRKICSESSMGLAWKPTGRSEYWGNQNNLLHCQKQGQTVYKIICRSSVTQRAKSISSLLKTRGLPKAYSLCSLLHKPSVSMAIIMPILPRAKQEIEEEDMEKGRSTDIARLQTTARLQLPKQSENWWKEGCLAKVEHSHTYTNGKNTFIMCLPLWDIGQCEKYPCLLVSFATRPVVLNLSHATTH